MDVECTNANLARIFCALIIANEMGIRGVRVRDISVDIRDNEIHISIPNSPSAWHGDLKAALDLSKG